MTTPSQGDDLGAFGASGLPAGGSGQPVDVSALIRERLADPGAGQKAPKSGATRLIVGAVILVLGVVGLLVRAMLLHKNIELWHYAWLTLPIAFGAGYLGYRLALGRGLGVGHLSGILVSTLGTSYLTGLTSGSTISSSLFGSMNINCLLQQSSAQGQADCASAAQAQPAETPWHAAQRIAENYWHLYGPVGIISAAVLGLIAGIGLAMVGHRNSR